MSPSASNLKVGKRISMLLKSPFGFAKTCAACSAAVDGPVWLAYWDKSEPVELQHFFTDIIKRPELLDNIEYDVYSSSNANEYLNKLIGLTKHCPYTTIINDSVTMMTASAVNWSIGFRSAKGAKRDPLNANAQLTIPEMDEYKVETSFVTQALDICRTLPCNVIWTCHPLPSLEFSGGGTTGQAMKVSKVNHIVSYGQKVGAIVPGQFTEIYHFSIENTWNAKLGKGEQKRLVSPRGIGDDFAKSGIGLVDSFDITDKLFWSVWKDEVAKLHKGE